MKKLVLTAATISSLAMIACGGGDKKDPPVLVDGGEGGTDGDIVDPTACNPVTQTGCETGEKCGELIIRNEEGGVFLAQIACIPEGNVTEDVACADGVPGQDTGYDDCAVGLDCFQGVCTPICGIAAGDTCRGNPDEGFGLGDNCANNFENHFTDEIGVCLPSCHPSDDAVVDGLAVNNVCGAGSSCGMNAVTTQTTCAGTPPDAAEKTQNVEPYGPAPGVYYSNGCESGFSTLLNEKSGADGGAAQCTRYCTPDATYLDINGVLVGNSEGVDTKCSTGGLNLVGGRDGHNEPHQCRYIQGIYGNTNLVPESVGMCMPILPAGGGNLELGNGATSGATWGDCTVFAWEELLTSWNAAAPNGEDAINVAFNEFCLTDPLDPPNSGINDKCVGFFFGCITLAMEAELMDPPSAARSASEFRAQFKLNMQATGAQLEELGL